MAEEQKQAETATPAPHGKKRALIAAGAVVSLLLVVGVPAGYFLMKPEAPKEVALVFPDLAPEPQYKPEGFEDEEELEEGEEPLGAIVPLETFLVNLSGGKYIRLQVQVEFETLDVPRRFYTRQVPIRDSIISVLTQLTAETLDATKGKENLRSQIRSLINSAIRKEEVRRVYITQFVIQ